MYKKIDKATEYLKNIVKLTPYCVIVCDSGLEGIETEMSISTNIPFTSIPGFKESNEEGVYSQLIYGILEDKYVLLVQGMPFLYEGLSLEEYALPFRVFANLGIKNIIFTTSCSSLKKSLKVGDFVLINDHLSLNAPNLLVGDNYYRFGPRFIDCKNIYDTILKKNLIEKLTDQDFSIKETTYAYISGPNYPTQLDIDFFKKIGIGCLGMNTVAEATLCHQLSMNILFLGHITSELFNSEKSLTHREIMMNTKIDSSKQKTLLHKIVRLLPKE